MMLSSQVSEPLPTKTSNENVNILHNLSMYEIEQNLIKKIVPMVVAIIKDTVAKRIYNAS